MAADRRGCPVTGCRNARGQGAAMCRRCWYKLPIDVRADVVRRWVIARKPGATVDDRLAHVAAVRLAKDLANANRNGAK